MYRVEWGTDDSVEFHLSHGDWIGLLRRSGFEIEDFRVGGEGKTDGIAAVAETYFVRHPIGSSVVHEN